MASRTSRLSWMSGVLVATIAIAVPVRSGAAGAQAVDPRAAVSGTDVAVAFRQQIQPLLAKYCVRCHSAEEMKSGVRVDRIAGALEDRHVSLAKAMREQLNDELMPPDDEPQPTPPEREALVRWLDQALLDVAARKRDKNGSIRRLTVAQYRNTLRDLLGFDEDLTDLLPADAVSADGFLNNEQAMQLSPLLIEAYLDIAEQALDRSIVDESATPVIQSFRVDLGAAINPNPCPDKLVLGALSMLLDNQDFIVTELEPPKPFQFQPFRMRTKHRFIEGYQGNDTVRGWREFDSIYHSVFACLRGSNGYPKGRAYQTVPEGLLLRPAIPSPEIFQVSSTYGPHANFKISLRELPEHGRFRVTVRAAKYDDALLLDPGTSPAEPTTSVASPHAVNPTSVAIDQAGIYQVDVYFEPAEKPDTLWLTLGARQFAGQLVPHGDGAEKAMAFLLVRLPAGPLPLTARYGDNSRLRRIALSRVDDDGDAAKRFVAFERRVPLLGVHLGLRRDCGSTLNRVGTVQPVSSRELESYVFEGAIRNFPSPDVEADNVNYLAGIREIGVRSEYTDGRDMPRLLVRSVEFEGPLYESWPPATHRNIFTNPVRAADRAVHAEQIIRSFAARAFRRPIRDSEAAALVAVWQQSLESTGDFRQSIKDALLVVLTSPQFLFIIENSLGPQPEPLDPHELASKLSYFLWNTAPDDELLALASAGTLHNSLDDQVDRLVRDRRFEQFTSEFAAQWLGLDKFDVVEIDRTRFPKLTRDTKSQLRREPIEYVQYLIRHNLPLRHLVESDFLVANEVVASYYGLPDRTENGFEFVAVRHGSDSLGGVLSQAAILAGNSNGRESNPVKRGAWLARKIIGEPPDEPLPNVPDLPADDGSTLTLREKLERHRNQPGCAKCHAGIDPWGLPLEQFDAGGLFKSSPVDARSTLPDKTEIASASELKAYLAGDRIDQVGLSFLKHLTAYAVGRSLSHNEIEYLRKNGLQLRPYRMQDMVRFVVTSEVFLEK